MSLKIGDLVRNNVEFGFTDPVTGDNSPDLFPRGTLFRVSGDVILERFHWDTGHPENCAGVQVTILTGKHAGKVHDYGVQRLDKI